MKRVTNGSLLVLLAFVLVGAIASAASAEEFIYSHTGKLKSKPLGIQTFTLESGLAIECKEATSEGEATSLKATTLGISILYGKCTAFSGSDEATVSLANYRFGTSPRSLTITAEPPLTILITGALKCHFIIKTPQTFSKAGEVEYKNHSGRITEESNLTGVESEVTESSEPAKCGKVGEKFKAGKFNGGQEVELLEGTIEIA
ncbi:MAG TPA: hypothetical protein VGP17_13370 [Solirubrobacteraceae bacterium]|nr:hypothetical protein [Solirubrobacteraceae bacterium]